jgi:concanavalin A-like lectin/glucanase superfamily protein
VTRSKVSFLSAALLLLLSGCGGGTTTPSGGASPEGCSSPTNDAYARAVLADKPAVYYRLDEAAGPSLCDASGNHNNGTYSATGLTYRQPGGPHHSSDTAIGADGTTQVAASNANSGISGSASFTLEGWFRTTAKQDQIVVEIGQAGAQTMAGLGPWMNQVSSTFVTTPGTGDYISFDTYDGAFQFDASAAGINVFDGNWHYTAVSFSTSSSMASVYLDNRALGSTSIADRPGASPVRIGFWVDALFNKPFDGGLDEIAVYPSALTADQIARHYAAGA